MFYARIRIYNLRFPCYDYLVDDSIHDSERHMKAHVAKTVHDSKTLMLDEMERYSNANLKKIEKLESHDKILCDHRDKLDAHTEQLGQLAACYA